MKSPHLLSAVHDLAICTRSVQSSQKRRFHRHDSDCSLNNTWPSFHTDRIDRAVVSPTTATPVPPASADFTPANCTGSISVCRFHASASHTSSIRIPRSSPDLEYPAWCSSSFHLTSSTQHSRRSPSADCSRLKWKSQRVLLTTPSGSL